MKSTVLRELSVFWSLLHILILFILLYRSKYSKKKTLVLTGIFMGPLVFLNVIGLTILGNEKMGQMFVLTCTIPSLFFFYLISKDQKWRFLFTFCLADTVAYWVMIVTNLLDYYLGKEQCVLMLISRLLLFPLIEWVAYHILRKPYLELQESVSKGWGIFTAMVALYYLLLIVMANFPTIITKREEYMPALLLVLVLMPLTYATIFVSLYRQLLLYRKRQSERIWQEQKIHLEAQLDSQQNLRKLQHDLKAHTITLSGLLVSGKIDEAQSYMWDMVYDMDASLQQFCANPYLNSVFSHFSQRFKKLEMELELDLKIGDEELPYMELCQILSNGLENACNALKELDVKDREASVQMKYNKDYLIIRIKNRCRGALHIEKGEIPPTDKKGKDHGFGLITIQEAAKRLDGDMFCYTEKGNFILDVMLRADSTIL